MANGYTKAERSANVKKQLRDKYGKWIEMGGKIKFLAAGLERVGDALDFQGEYVISEYKASSGATVKVKIHRSAVTAVKAKASLKDADKPDAPETPPLPAPATPKTVATDVPSEDDLPAVDEVPDGNPVAVSKVQPDGFTYDYNNLFEATPLDENTPLLTPVSELQVGDEILRLPTKVPNQYSNELNAPKQRFYADSIATVIQINEDGSVEVVDEDHITTKLHPKAFKSYGPDTGVLLNTKAIIDGVDDANVKAAVDEDEAAEEKALLDASSPQVKRLVQLGLDYDVAVAIDEAKTMEEALHNWYNPTQPDQDKTGVDIEEVVKTYESYDVQDSFHKKYIAAHDAAKAEMKSKPSVPNPKYKTEPPTPTPLYGEDADFGPYVTADSHVTSDDVDPETYSVVDAYIHYSYSTVNGALRKDELDKYKETAKKVGLLDAVIESNKTNTDLQIFRGARGAWIDSLTEGQTLNDKGFVSTTLSEPIANLFATTQGKAEETGAIFRFTLPAGSSHLNMDTFNKVPESKLNTTEREVLLPRGINLQIDSISEPDKNNVRTIEATLLGFGEQPEQQAEIPLINKINGPTPSPYVPSSDDAVQKMFDDAAKNWGDPNYKHEMIKEAEPPASADPISIADWTKTGSQKGSNPGGTYTAPDGQEYYVKIAKSDDHARNEVLAARLYDAAGIPMADLQLVDVGNGKLGTASPIIPNSQADLYDHLNDKAYIKEIQRGFAMNAWTANWDVAGLEYDNVITNGDGVPVRIDPGGALIFRAMGAPKNAAFGDSVGEWETLRNGSNTQSTKLFGSMTEADRVNSAKIVAKFDDFTIDSIVDKIGFDAQTTEMLKARLKARRDDLLNRAGLEKDEVNATSTEEADTSEGGLGEGPSGLDGGPGDSNAAGEADDEEAAASEVGPLNLNPTQDNAEPAEVNALKKYQLAAHQNINGSLRGTQTNPTQETIEYIDQIDTLMAKSINPTDLEVYRGAYGPAFANLEEGSTIQDLGFVSTTTSEFVADDFSGGNADGVIFQFTLPAGAHVVDMDAFWGQKDWDDSEEEYLLPRGGSLVVNSVVDMGPDMPRVVQATYVPAPVKGQPGFIEHGLTSTPADTGAPNSSDPFSFPPMDSPAVEESETLTIGEVGPAVWGPMPTFEQVDQDTNDALEFYTANGYEQINGALRNNDENALGFLADNISKMDDVIDQYSVGEDIELLRGVKQEFLEKLQVGDTITDLGFVSATNDLEIAEDFTGYQPGGAIIEFTLPAGYKALNVDHFLISDGYSGSEHEFILPRGTSFTIDSIEDSGAGLGYKTIHATLIPAGPQAFDPKAITPASKAFAVPEAYDPAQDDPWYIPPTPEATPETTPDASVDVSEAPSIAVGTQLTAGNVEQALTDLPAGSELRMVGFSNQVDVVIRKNADGSWANANTGNVVFEELQNIKNSLNAVYYTLTVEKVGGESTFGEGDSLQPEQLNDLPVGSVLDIDGLSMTKTGEGQWIDDDGDSIDQEFISVIAEDNAVPIKLAAIGDGTPPTPPNDAPSAAVPDEPEELAEWEKELLYGSPAEGDVLNIKDKYTYAPVGTVAYDDAGDNFTKTGSDEWTAEDGGTFTNEDLVGLPLTVGTTKQSEPAVVNTPGSAFEGTAANLNSLPVGATIQSYADEIKYKKQSDDVWVNELGDTSDPNAMAGWQEEFMVIDSVFFHGVDDRISTEIGTEFQGTKDNLDSLPAGTVIHSLADGIYYQKSDSGPQWVSAESSVYSSSTINAWNEKFEIAEYADYSYAVNEYEDYDDDDDDAYDSAADAISLSPDQSGEAGDVIFGSEANLNFLPLNTQITSNDDGLTYVKTADDEWTQSNGTTYGPVSMGSWNETFHIDEVGEVLADDAFFGNQKAFDAYPVGTKIKSSYDGAVYTKAPEGDGVWVSDAGSTYTSGTMDAWGEMFTVVNVPDDPGFNNPSGDIPDWNMPAVGDVITTPAQLDALPVGATIKHSGGIYTKVSPEYWHDQWNNPNTSNMFANDYGVVPNTVITGLPAANTPDAATPDFVPGNDVTTVAELNALPAGSIVSMSGVEFAKQDDASWKSSGGFFYSASELTPVYADSDTLTNTGKIVSIPGVEAPSAEPITTPVQTEKPSGHSLPSKNGDPIFVGTSVYNPNLNKTGIVVGWNTNGYEVKVWVHETQKVHGWKADKLTVGEHFPEATSASKAKKFYAANPDKVPGASTVPPAIGAPVTKANVDTLPTGAVISTLIGSKYVKQADGQWKALKQDGSLSSWSVQSKNLSWTNEWTYSDQFDAAPTAESELKVGDTPSKFEFYKLPVGSTIVTKEGTKWYKVTADNKWDNNPNSKEPLDAEKVNFVQGVWAINSIGPETKTPSVDVPPVAGYDDGVSVGSTVNQAQADALPIGSEITYSTNGATYTKTAATDTWVGADGETTLEDLNWSGDNGGFWTITQLGDSTDEGPAVGSKLDQAQADALPVGSKMIFSKTKTVWTKNESGKWNSEVYSADTHPGLPSSSLNWTGGEYYWTLESTPEPAAPAVPSTPEMSFSAGDPLTSVGDLDALPVGSVITQSGFTFTKNQDETWTSISGVSVGLSSSLFADNDGSINNTELVSLPEGAAPVGNALNFGDPILDADTFDVLPVGSKVNFSGVELTKSDDSTWVSANGFGYPTSDLVSNIDDVTYAGGPSETPATPSTPATSNGQFTVGDLINSSETLDQLPVGTVVLHTGDKYVKHTSGKWDTVDNETPSGQYNSWMFGFNNGTTAKIVSLPTSESAPAPEFFVGQQFSSSEGLDSLPVGTEINHSGMKYKKYDNGKWSPVESTYETGIHPSTDFGWFGGDDTEVVALPDLTSQTSPATPQFGVGQTVNSEAGMDALPAGTQITYKGVGTYLKTNNGKWTVNNNGTKTVDSNATLNPFDFDPSSSSIVIKSLPDATSTYTGPGVGETANTEEHFNKLPVFSVLQSKAVPGITFTKTSETEFTSDQNGLKYSTTDFAGSFNVKSIPGQEPMAPKPPEGAKSLPSKNGDPIYQGSFVTNPTLGHTGIVVGWNTNGYEVKVYVQATNKVHGWKADKLIVGAYVPNITGGAAAKHFLANSGTTSTATSTSSASTPTVPSTPPKMSSASVGATFGDADNFAGASPDPHNASKTQMPSVLQATVDVDQSNPLFGSPEPVAPVAPAALSGDWVSEDWVNKVKQRYLDFPGKAKPSLEQSNNWGTVQNVITSGSIESLQKLKTAKYIDDALFDDAKKQVELRASSTKKLQADYDKLVDAYSKELGAWKAANGVVTTSNGYEDMPRASSKPFFGGEADWHAAHPGTPTLASALSKIKKSISVARHGLSVALDGSKIEDMDVRMRRIHDIKGDERIEMTFKVTSAHGDFLNKKLAQMGVSTTSSASIANQLIPDIGLPKDTSGTVYSAPGKTYTFSPPGSTTKISFMRASGKSEISPNALNNMVRVLMPATADENEVAKTLDALGIEPKPSSEGDIRVYAENKLLSIFGKHTDPTKNKTGSSRQKSLDEIKAKFNVKADDLIMTTDSNGRIKFLLPDAIRDKLISMYNVQGFNHNVSAQNAEDWVNILSEPNAGITATRVRWSEGINASGMSSSPDMNSGGADYVFTTPLHHKPTSGESYGSKVIIHPKAAMRRTDIYGNNSDKYGQHFDNISVYDLIGSQPYEILFKHAVPVSDMWYVNMAEGMRQSVIEKLKLKGVTEINGIPIEQFIISSGMNVPKVDETQWDITVAP